MKRKILKTDCELYKKIEKLENIMNDLGISIHGQWLTLDYIKGEKSITLKVGPDNSSFPRELDEPFIVYGSEK